jgi:cysteine desulfurase family protein (TIGR01976 family)
MATLDLEWIRSQFPSLAQDVNGQPAVFFDAPGGTQVPQRTIEAISNYLLTSNANLHGAFATSARTDVVVLNARSSIADFLNCDPDEIVFGANMTTLTFAISRAIGRELQAGDEIVVTSLDHDANVAPWLALSERGVTIQTVGIHPEDCTLDMADFERKISDRTKLVAIGSASNAVGTINDVKQAVKLARKVGAWVFVDAVHYAPHGAIDVQDLDCDFLACSAYKFFAPHVGILYAKRDHLARLHPYKVRPASDEVPSCWETGTQSFEGLAGLIATIDYLAELGQKISPTVSDRRTALRTAMDTIQREERSLSEKLIPNLLDIPGITVYGIIDPNQFDRRTPTVSIRLKGQTPEQLAKALGDRGVFTWNGNFYALNLTQALDVESSGGLLRIGLAHYNTSEEIGILLTALQELSR